MDFESIKNKLGTVQAYVLYWAQLSPSEKEAISFQEILAVIKHPQYLKKVEVRDEILALAKSMVENFEQAVKLWEATPPESSEKDEALALSKSMVENFEEQVVKLWEATPPESSEETAAWALAKSMVENFDHAVWLWKRTPSESSEKDEAWALLEKYKPSLS